MTTSNIGREGCPCINPFALASQPANISDTGTEVEIKKKCIELSLAATTAPHDVPPPFASLFDMNESSNLQGPQLPVFSTSGSSVDICAPINFGSYCSSHADICGDHECLTSQSEWCFVNKHNCDILRDYSPLFNHTSASADNDVDDGCDEVEIGFSYKTCGNLKSYSSTVIDEQFWALKGSTIRVAYPNPIDDLVTTRKRPDGTIDGLPIQLLKEILFDPLELKIENVERSAESDNRFNSTFTACAHDIGIGVADICIDSFFITQERLGLSHFGTPHFKNDLVFIVTTPRTISQVPLSTRLLTPFNPFAPTTWALIISASLYMAIIYRFILKDDEAKDSHRYRQEKSADYHRLRRRIAGSFGISIYDAFVGLVTADGSIVRDHRGISPEGRVVMFGYMIFAFMFMSAYTASFTLRLVSEPVVESSEFTFQEIINRGEKICILKALASTLRDNRGGLQILKAPESLIETLQNEDIARNLNMGNCRGGIMTTTAYLNLKATNHAFCNARIVDGTFELEPGMPFLEIGMPVGPKFLQAFNFAMNDGGVEKFNFKFNQTVERSIVSSGGAMCPQVDEVTNTNQVGLSISQMSFPIIITLFCSTIACAMKVRKRVRSFHLIQNRLSQMSKFKNDTLRILEDNKTPEECLFDELESMPISKLRSIVKRNCTITQSEALKHAMNSLPDSKLLIDLAWQQLSSENYAGKVRYLKSQTLFDIYNMVDDIQLSREVMDAALDAESPKDELVRLVMESWHHLVPCINNDVD